MIGKYTAYIQWIIQDQIGLLIHIDRIPMRSTIRQHRLIA